MTAPRIWKFPIDAADRQVLTMPAGAQLLCVALQKGQPTLWALVDEQAPPDSRFIITVGTGHRCAPDLGAYLGRYQLISGDLVFHVFEAAS